MVSSFSILERKLINAAAAAAVSKMLILLNHPVLQLAKMDTNLKSHMLFYSRARNSIGNVGIFNRRPE